MKEGKKEQDCPKVKVEVVPCRGINLLKINCPYCGKTHTHGGGHTYESKLRLGHRTSHCIGYENIGYILVE